MAAILNFSKTLKKLLADLHIVGNVIVKSEKSLAHPHDARNVMLKFEKKK